RLIDDPALTSAPIPCSTGRCRVFALDVLPADLSAQPEAWWNANAWSYAPDNTWNATPGTALAGTGLARRDPQFVIEEVEEVTDSLTIPPTGPPPSRIYYRITSAAQGGTNTAQAVVQSTFTRRFNCTARPTRTETDQRSMSRITQTIHKATWLAGVGPMVVFSGSSVAAPLELQDVPLFLSTGAEPNVMLMVDNSGSMSNIVPDEPYDPNTVYLTSCPSTRRVSTSTEVQL